MYSGKIKRNVVVYLYRGVGLVVECLPSKQETRVRFSYAAQNKNSLAYCQAFLISLQPSKRIEQEGGRGNESFPVEENSDQRER